MGDLGIGAGLSAIAFWGFIAACVWAGVWDSARKREAQHETLRRLIETGQSPDDAMIDKLLGDRTNTGRDLRAAGLILLFLGPGLAALAWFVGQQASGALMPILGAAAVVASLSAGLLVAAWIHDRGEPKDGSSALGDRQR